MTVLGDFNQAIFAHALHHVDFSMLTELYGPDETNMINLTQSYRSTKPIIEFSRCLVPGGDQISAFEREGEKPVLTMMADRNELHNRIAKQIEEWKGRDYHSIAVICKSAAESESAYASLRNVGDINLIKKDTLAYEQGVVVIPAYLAKGIEFDAVIIYDASSLIYSNESMHRLFYTACTRAMHALKLFSLGNPNPFFKDIPSTLYNRNLPK